MISQKPLDVSVVLEVLERQLHFMLPLKHRRVREYIHALTANFSEHAGVRVGNVVDSVLSIGRPAGLDSEALRIALRNVLQVACADWDHDTTVAAADLWRAQLERDR